MLPAVCICMCVFMCAYLQTPLAASVSLLEERVCACVCERETEREREMHQPRPNAKPCQGKQGSTMPLCAVFPSSKSMSLFSLAVKQITLACYAITKQG